MNFYFEASKILDRLDSKQGSIKGVLATVPEKDRKRTSALVIETLKYKSVLNDVIIQSKLLKEERKVTSTNLALVLVHDLLLSNGIQAGDGPIKQAILRHKTRLHSEFQRIKIKRGVQSDSQLAQMGDSRAALIPRYVRVNTNIWNTADAIKYFTTKGFNLSDPHKSSQGFAQDEHVSNLLSFAPQTRFHEDSVYQTGKIILQDKASCFPATVLVQDIGNGDVIDATAAPGNKTSHLSALMNNKGKLFAFERDRKRFLTLKKMLSKAGCRNTEPTNIDFLTVSPDDPKYAGVTHILLDPSCSGSGIVNRLDHLLEQDIVNAPTDEAENSTQQDDRLNKLASFQLLMIKHAMKFPNVTRIVYSTCSIHPTENEHVVNQALNSTMEFRLAPQEQVLPTWHRRGLSKEMDPPEAASGLVRCDPSADGTNGFFVSCFIRLQSNFKLTDQHEETSGYNPKSTEGRKRKWGDTNKEEESKDGDLESGARPPGPDIQKTRDRKKKRKHKVLAGVSLSLGSRE